MRHRTSFIPNKITPGVLELGAGSKENTGESIKVRKVEVKIFWVKKLIAFFSHWF